MRLFTNKTLIPLLFMTMGGGIGTAHAQQPDQTFYTNDYENAVVTWKSSVGGRYTPIIMSDDTKYMSVTQAERQNNGAVLTSTETEKTVQAGTDFTLTCRVKLGATNNQTATAFNIYDASNSNKILSIAEKSTYATDWTINDNIDQKATVSAGNVKGGNNIDQHFWVKIQLTYKKGVTYLTLKDAKDQIISGFDKTIITSLSTTGGLGKMEFITSRYNANFAIDDIVVRKVLSTDVPAGTPIEYTVTAKAGNEILGVISSGNALDDGSTTVSYSKYMQKNNKWYETTAPYVVAVDKADIVVNYTESAQYFHYFYEAENISNATGVTENNNNSNNGNAAITARKIGNLGTLTAGTYDITAYVTGATNRGVYFRNTANSDNKTNVLCNLVTKNDAVNKEYTQTITLDAATTVGITGYTIDSTRTNQSSNFDYVYIKKLTETIALPNDYNSYCSSYALDFTNNTDVEAYAAKMNAAGTSVVLTKVNMVPANTGVILKKVGSATTASVPVVATANELTDNQLKGAVTEMDAATLVAENAYVLNKLNGKTVFSKVTNATTGKLAAGKAYLAVPASSSMKTLTVVFDDATAIVEVETENSENNNEMYNINGMRVKNTNAPGMYIVNGKKFIVK